MSKLNSLLKYFRKINSIHQEVQALRVEIGRIHSHLLKSASSYEDSEFQVFSQWGEDGIIQFILNRIPDCPKTFVEFGVEDFTEANTRFLLLKDYWDGLVIDGSEKNISQIKASPLFWRSRLKAVNEFITKDNINAIIASAGFSGEIGILSVDIDGNDYWVWDQISVVKPVIVIAEYNGLWGPTERVTTPYKPDFYRGTAHYSHLYWGTSVAALEYLAHQKGYRVVAGNKAGNNIFFVREEFSGLFERTTAAQVYRKPFFREARTPDGNLSFLGFSESLELLKSELLTDVETLEVKTIGDIFQL